MFEPFCSDGPLSGVAFFWAGEGATWPVVLFSSFCAPLVLWLVVDGDWLLDDDEPLSDFTLTLPSNPRAVTVRVSMRPFASRFLTLEGDQRGVGSGVEHTGDTPAQVAAPDENRLNLADLRLAEVHGHNRARRRVADTRAAAYRNHVDDLLAAVHERSLLP